MLDLNSLRCEGEVLEASKKGFLDLSSGLKVALFAPNQHEQMKSVVEMIGLKRMTSLCYRREK